MYSYKQKDLHNHGVNISTRPYTKEESERMIDGLKKKAKEEHCAGRDVTPGKNEVISSLIHHFLAFFTSKQEQ